MADQRRILIERSQNSMKGGGEDRITLHDLLEEAGYKGNFEVRLVEETEDDYLELYFLLGITV